MPKYIAFLRAINVGGHVVKMAQLKTLFEELGFSNVETFIASGNVIFDTAAKNISSLERKIEKHLNEKLGYEVATFIRTPAELLKLVEHKPFSDEDLNEEGHTVFVGFLPEEPGEEVVTALLGLQTRVDAFQCHGSHLYWLCRGKFGDSIFSGAKLEKCLKMATTIRNSNTVRRLVEKYASS